jgi:hypothetical protein
VALASEKTRSGLIHALMQCEFVVLYPLNAEAVARYRQTFATSRPKDDPTDAELLLDLLAKHRDEFRPWQPDSATTLDATLASKLEPRTAMSVARLWAIWELTKAGIPAGVSVAPVILGLTDHELPATVKAAAEEGAQFAGMVPV